MIGTGNRTIYEAAIPWIELKPLAPHADAIAGFSIAISDNDGQPQQNRIGYIEWGGGILGDAGKQPGRFIGLRLVK